MKTAVLSLIISILVAIFAFYEFEYYQRFVTNTEASAKEVKQLEEQVARLNQTVQVLQQKVQTQEMRLNQAQQTANTASEALNPTAAQTAAQQHIIEGLYIFEAYQLSLLAQQNLMMGNNVTTALTLLTDADQSLQKVQDHAVDPIRQMLQKDIEALKAVPLPDIEGIWSTVGKLIENSSNLRTQGVRNLAAGESYETKTSANLPTNGSADKSRAATEGRSNNSNVNPSANPSEFQQTLEKSWSHFSDLIKIQRHTKPVEPILSQEEQMLAAEHLRLSLEQIRWSLLHRNPTLYQNSIQEALELLHTYFEPSDPQVKQFESTLMSIAKINIKPEVPDLKPLIHLFQAQGEK